MPSATDFPNAVLKRVGTIKNELLGFTVIVCLILNVFAIPLEKGSSTQMQIVGGLIMHLATIPILLGFGFLYWYAYLRLPSSKQELLFSEEAKTMISQHTRQMKKLPPTDP
jgi:heme/copper-type cytochrome/quinol oxidase subunit 4